MRAALGVGLTHLAIADHDSVDGIAEAHNAALGTSLTVIPAVELSALDENDNDVHILGFHIDTGSRPFLTALDDLRSGRVRRAEAMTDSLSRMGARISLDDVLALSSGGAVGRSHVARALVAAGHADSVSSAFDQLIGRDRPHYIAKETHTVEVAIELILEAGGIPVIAHPGIHELVALTRRLTHHGLAGIEAYHADHSPVQRLMYANLADELGLLVTGGTDFHSPDGPNPPLGQVDYPEDALVAFLAAGPSV